MWVEPMERRDEGENLRVVLNLRGIGDVIAMAYAVAYLKAHNPHRRIIFDVVDKTLPWAQLFTDAHETVGHERGATHIDAITKTGAAYPARFFYNSNFTRHHHFAKKVNAKPMMPTHVTPTAFDWSTAGLDRPAVVIVPQSTGQNRMWPEQKWAQLAAKLESDGVPVLALTNANWGRCYKAKDPPDMLALLNSAPLIIANDTGPAHLAAMLGKYVITLNGIENGEGIFGIYPRARAIQAKAVGGKQCSPCGRMTRYGYSTICEGWCQALAEIAVDEVYAEAVNILSCEEMPCAI
jgi:Glycosyltransferase family 9 (heptosyltransferase)